jgi:hypothetical protein
MSGAADGGPPAGRGCGEDTTEGTREVDIMRTMFWLQIVLAAADGQLGEQQAAAAAGRALTTQFSNFSADPRAILHTRLQVPLANRMRPRSRYRA